MQNGDVVYAKVVKTSSKKGKGARITAQGHFISLLIGHVNPGDEGLSTINEVEELLACSGYASFDDMISVFGDDAFIKMEKFLRKKWKKEIKTVNEVYEKDGVKLIRVKRV